ELRAHAVAFVGERIALHLARVGRDVVDAVVLRHLREPGRCNATAGGQRRHRAQEAPALGGDETHAPRVLQAIVRHGSSGQAVSAAPAPLPPASLSVDPRASGKASGYSAASVASATAPSFARHATASDWMLQLSSARIASPDATPPSPSIAAPTSTRQTRGY